MSQLEAEFAALGFEVYSQNFSAVKPLSVDSKVRFFIVGSQNADTLGPEVSPFLKPCL